MTSAEKRANPKMQGAQNKNLQRKKRTPKHNWLKTKTSDEKWGNPKTQGA
jgi:hypothetical protein